MKTKLKDHQIDLEITSTYALDATDDLFLSLVKAVRVLNATLPMAAYAITRTGVTDVWVVSATARDARVYATTVTVVGGVTTYTLTSLPAATKYEVDAFLAVVRAFEVYLKPCEVSGVTIVW